MSPAAASPFAAPNMSLIVAQLRQLHGKGILTDSEYQARRAEIISQL